MGFECGTKSEDWTEVKCCDLVLMLSAMLLCFLKLKATKKIISQKLKKVLDENRVRCYTCQATFRKEGFESCLNIAYGEVSKWS